MAKFLKSVLMGHIRTFTYLELPSQTFVSLTGNFLSVEVVSGWYLPLFMVDQRVGKGNLIVACSRSGKTYFKKSTPLEIYIKSFFPNAGFTLILFLNSLNLKLN